MDLNEKSSTPDLPHSSSSTRSDEKRILQKVTDVLTRWGVETHGITPIPPKDRVDAHLYQMFFVWFSANFNILAFSTGSAGPAFFSLGLRDSLIIILVADIICCIVPAYFAIFGPKLGTRAMVQARFSWGYYGAIIPSVLNVFSGEGFLILNCIIGGQTLASVSDHLNATLGIVIISILSMVVTFCGYRVIHWYESIAWFPNAIAFIVMLGVGGKHLRVGSYPEYPAPTASNVLSFTSFVASSVISWCGMTPDYGVYHSAKASSTRIYVYTYLGFFLASITGHMMGAAFAAAAPAVPSWQAAFGNGNDVGGLINAILSPAGGFGKFLVVIISLSIPSACAPTMYTFGTSFMAITPFFAKIPRYIFIIISEAMHVPTLIPIAIVGAVRFYATLVDILSVIGYWATAFAAIVLAEHVIFRKGDYSLYTVEDWDKPLRLPVGMAAVFSFIGAFGIIVPSMAQVWYTGPIADAGTGDIGVLTGFVVAGALYVVFRTIERRMSPARTS